MSEIPPETSAAPAHGDARGFLAAFGAYGLWGVLILYFALLDPAGPIEIIGWRILLSILVTVLALAALRRLRGFLALFRERRTIGAFSAAGVLIAANWLAFVAAVTSGNALEAALGYYINPLVAVLLGMLVLGERMRPLQWAAVGVATIAVLVESIALGHVPWYSLAIAVSFGLYGLVKKRVADRVPALEGLALETTLIAPLGAACLVWAAVDGGGLTLGTAGAAHAIAMLLLGVVTSVPLLLYGAAAKHLRLVELGLMQYLAPTIMFIVSVLVLHEEMPSARWIGFGIVWISLALFVADALRASRSRRTAARDTAGAPAAAD